MTKIEFVYFDLGNILVSFDPALACQNIARLCGTTANDVQTVLYDSGLEERYEHGEVTEDQLAETLRNELDQSDSQVSTQALLDALGDMFTPIDSMTDVIARVRQAGLRIGILSNTCFAHWDWVVRQAWPVMQGPFETTILSYEVGAMKPDAKIYAAAESESGVAPERLMFIDDKAENVAAAIARGWNAAQCFGGDDAVEQLKKFGVIS